jgi:small redox-active disulfide protein 2
MKRESFEPMKIEIFGTGCAKCEKTAREVEKVVSELGVDAAVEHVTDMKQIVDRGVMITPAVFVDGEKKIEGKVPRSSDIASWLRP